MFPRHTGQRKKDEPTSLPIPKIADRPLGREMLIGFCLTALFFILGWSALSNILSDHTTPELQRGLKALSEGQVPEADHYFDTVVNQRPKDASLYLRILAACQQRGEWSLLVKYGERGIRACQTAPAEVRSALHEHLTFGYLGEKRANWEQKAIAEARSAWTLNRTDPQLMNHYGYILADVGKTEKEWALAERLVTQALDMVRPQARTPENRMLLASIKDSHGWVLYRQQRHGEAVRVLSDALNEVPQELEVPGSVLKELYYHLGAAYRQVGRSEEARRMLDVALYYAPNFREAREERAALDTPRNAPGPPGAWLPGDQYDPFGVTTRPP